MEVPGQVSVIGFDNTVASSLVTPGLTTVASPLVSLGEAAMRNVIALGRGATPHGKGPTVIPCRLIVRESTGPPPPVPACDESQGTSRSLCGPHQAGG